MTIENVAIRPMDRDFLLWRCLHGGPLSAENLDAPPEVEGMDWAALRGRNLPLLALLTETYGSCAMLAWDGDLVVGYARFYPQPVWDLTAAGHMCLQQFAPNGPSAELAAQRLPPLSELTDRTLRVHCLMTGSPQQRENPYRRKGLGTRLVRALIDWATTQGWAAIEATAYEEIPALYEISGQAGRRWWERLGFVVAEVGVEPGIEGGLLDLVRRQASELGLPEDQATNRYTMRLALAPWRPRTAWRVAETIPCAGASIDTAHDEKEGSR